MSGEPNKIGFGIFYVVFAVGCFYALAYGCGAGIGYGNKAYVERHKPPPPKQCSTDHRFTSVEAYPVDLRPNIALDSCTGQICRTWDWDVAWSKGGGDTGAAAYRSAPLCSQLPNTVPQR